MFPWGLIMPSDTWLQTLVMGMYGGSGNVYYSGAGPANQMLALGNDAAYQSSATDHPYARTIGQRLTQATVEYVGKDRDYLQWSAPGALRDYGATQAVTPSYSGAQATGQTSGAPSPNVVQRGLDKLGNLAPFSGLGMLFKAIGGSSDPTNPSSVLSQVGINVVILLVGIILLSIAAYSIVIPSSARGAIAVKGAEALL